MALLYIINQYLFTYRAFIQMRYLFYIINSKKNSPQNMDTT